jgi:molybdopterin-guanine dinucleotide biosynthesis protein A
VYRTALADTVERLIAEDRMRPAFLFEACRVKRLDAAALLADPALAALDPDLESVLNLNEPGDYEAARGRPAPEITVRVFGALRRHVAAGPDPALVVAATLAEAAAATGLALDEHVVAALNGDQITRDPETPLAAGDAIAFLAADAGG